MSRNRFKLLLNMLHFSDNEQCPGGERLQKIQPLLGMLIKKFQAIYTSGKIVCTDETMISFQGRLVFKQYNPQNGYTWNISNYSGILKPPHNSLTVSSQIVLKLSKRLLHSCGLYVIDSLYTSVQLADILLIQKMRCLGILRAKRKQNPTEIRKKEFSLIPWDFRLTECVLRRGDKLSFTDISYRRNGRNSTTRTFKSQ